MITGHTIPTDTEDGLSLSVIIPTLNEAESVRRLVESLRTALPQAEVIVTDGGSSDDTVQLAMLAGARVLACQRGRGWQLHGGAQAATGHVLWFLHADSNLPCPQEDWQAICQALRDEAVVGGHFRPVFAGDLWSARFMTVFYDVVTACGLAYGDTGYFVRADAYRKAGGFERRLLFEDIHLQQRLVRCGRFVRLKRRLITSGRRFISELPFWWCFSQWWAFQILYWLGAPPNWLGRMYYAGVRGK